jgi:hypothetical protein
MTYDFSNKIDFIVVSETKGTIIFKLGPDTIQPTENEDGSLNWSDAISLQAERNAISNALVDPVKQQRFAELLEANANTAYSIFLTEI